MRWNVALPHLFDQRPRLSDAGSYSQTWVVAENPSVLITAGIHQAPANALQKSIAKFLPRNQLVHVTDRAQDGVQMREALLGMPSLNQLPHALHQQGQLAHVRFVVGLRLVPHPGHDHDLLAIEHRNIHVASNVNVPFGITLFQRIGGDVVVGDDRFALADSFAP